jgi:dienelactone hydrolase
MRPVASQQFRQRPDGVRTLGVSAAGDARDFLATTAANDRLGRTAATGTVQHKRIERECHMRCPRFAVFWKGLIIGAALIALALGEASSRAGEPPESSAARDLVQPQIIKIPMKGGGVFGGEIEMVTHLYLPATERRVPVVVFLHGRGDREKRAELKYPVAVGHGNFWLRKGFAVVAPVRPGYGETGGGDGEEAGANWRRGGCTGNPDFARVASAAAEAVVTVLAWVREQPWAASDRIILEGVSMGGLAAVAVGARNPPGVVGVINFSGGSAGSPESSPGRSCMPERLTRTFGEFGKTTRIPSLWLYAENDLYWGPEAPREWHRAFSAGGSQTQFVMTPPVPGVKDGHLLLLRGGPLWSPHVNAFVEELGFGRR